MIPFTLDNRKGFIFRETKQLIPSSFILPAGGNIGIIKVGGNLVLSAQDPVYV